MPVPKKDGRIRLCGDYKLTINPELDIERYPLPKPQELFATLAGGKNSLNSISVRHNYLQLPLQESSRSYVTINTPRGLYQFTRLSFGVSSAPALFKKTMDTILQGLSGVKCYIDDILVTGATDQEHMRNLECVLKRLQTHGLRLKRDNCSFLEPSVEYLGFRVDAVGLHPSLDKLRAVTQAPKPWNVQELRSFLGLINYYRSLSLICLHYCFLFIPYCRRTTPGDGQETVTQHSRKPKTAWCQTLFLSITVHHCQYVWLLMRLSGV